MGTLGMKSDYEELRKARILENQARHIVQFVILAMVLFADVVLRLDMVKPTLPEEAKDGSNWEEHHSYSEGDVEDDIMKKPANVPWLRVNDLLPEALARRCTRLKFGKSDCSICHSSNGVLCRGCLKARYGEVLKLCKYVIELEEVRANKGWRILPKEAKDGSNWEERAQRFVSRKMGYKSVAHLLMAQLQGAVKGR
ncbi:hypothetical protein RND71_029419 [Anisodus tanguticus]|uniref:Uncharacterized protein n=1 Tax=Anisodus tanguticus TaxID=243964 RepID=A0AAE1RFE6_9SOLA|nr:hypothetical protein RND71_029419 [Anisodus tanguticus]